MSRRYSSCRSLRSPNIRSSSTSEKPITAFSGVRSSWDMLARKSDLCWLTTSSSALLTSSSRNSRAFEDRQGGLARERLQELDRLRRERARRSGGAPPARR